MPAKISFAPGLLNLVATPAGDRLQKSRSISGMCGHTVWLTFTGNAAANTSFIGDQYKRCGGLRAMGDSDGNLPALYKWLAGGERRPVSDTGTKQRSNHQRRPWRRIHRFGVSVRSNGRPATAVLIRATRMFK